MSFRPARGAWIETGFDCQTHMSLTAFAPHAGRGLKLSVAKSSTVLDSARREMGVELKTAVVWDRVFGEDIRVRGDLRRADGDLCVAGTGFG